MQPAPRLLPLVLLTARLGSACGGDITPPPPSPPPPDKVLSSLTVVPDLDTLFTRAPGNTVQLAVEPRDQFDQPMTGLGAPSFTVSSPAVATVSPTGLVAAVSTGTTAVTASLTEGGITRTATATVRVEEAPEFATVHSMGSGTGGVCCYRPEVVDIRIGGSVTWVFDPQGGQNTVIPHNIVFESGDAPANVPDQVGGSATRAFPKSGTYAYQCTIHPQQTGTVIVH